jgi:hypothetical protein
LRYAKKLDKTELKYANKIFKLLQTKAFFALLKTAWFYGYRLHGVHTFPGVFQSIHLTKAGVHDLEPNICFCIAWRQSLSILNTTIRFI